MFGQDPRLPGLAILRGGSPVGIVFRKTMPAPFSLRLFGFGPVTAFMDPSPVMVRVSSGIGEVGRRSGDRFLRVRMEEGSLIPDGTRFVGIGTWKALMESLAGFREDVFSTISFFVSWSSPAKIRGGS